jgi:hypothetical protein
MSVLEIQKAIRELSPAEVFELDSWFKSQLPWYQQEPFKTQILATKERLDAREPVETDLDALEVRLFGQTIADLEN